jgi:hypothetical protein
VGLGGGKRKEKESNHSRRPQMPLPHVVTCPEALNDDGWVGGANKTKARIRHLLGDRVYRMSSLQRFSRPLFVLAVEEEERGLFAPRDPTPPLHPGVNKWCGPLKQSKVWFKFIL